MCSSKNNYFDTFINFYENNIKWKMDRLSGFFVLLFFSIIIFYFLIKHILNLDLFKQSFYDLLITFVFILIFCFFVWLFIRKTPIFKKNEAVIIIALSVSDDDLNKELSILSDKLNVIVDAEEFKTKINIKLLPNRLSPKKREDAYSLLRKFGADLIIWGFFEKGNHQSRNVTVLNPIMFSYQLPNFLSINKNISSLLKQKSWVITNENNIFERDYIANNIEEISLYIIGLELFFFGDFVKAMDILSRVLLKYKSRTPLAHCDRVAINNIKQVIFYIFSEKTRELELWPGSCKRLKHIITAKKMILEMENCSMKEETLLIKSQVAFAENNLLDAKKYIDDCIQFFPNDPASFFSKAFILYYNGDIKNGYAAIMKAVSLNPIYIGEQLVLISIWYEEALKENSQKVYLNFPMGVIYQIQGNYLLSEKCFEEILHLYQNDESKIAKKMFYYSKKSLKKIKQIK